MWSWVLGFVGVLGFILAGKKIWWSWYINLGNQILWLIYSLVTEQYGFLVATAVYTVVFTKNAIAWTRDRNEDSIQNVLNVTYERDGSVSYHDENTLSKVYQGLIDAALTPAQAVDAVSQMQNHGIFFREYRKVTD